VNRSIKNKVAALMLATERLVEQPLWVKMSRATHFVGTAGLPQ
jgi:hypothetical protein